MEQLNFTQKMHMWFLKIYFAKCNYKIISTVQFYSLLCWIGFDVFKLYLKLSEIDGDSYDTLCTERNHPV